MRRDRTLIILMALTGAFFIAQFSLEAAIIGGAVSLWVIACALIPAPADQIGDTREPDRIPRAGARH